MSDPESIANNVALNTADSDGDSSDTSADETADSVAAGEPADANKAASAPEEAAKSAELAPAPTPASKRASAEAPATTGAERDTRPNPFKLLAGVFRDLRSSIEESSGDRPPRWVRIARARHALPRPLKSPAKALAEAPGSGDQQGIQKAEAVPAKGRQEGIKRAEAPPAKGARSPEAIMSDGIGSLLGGFINALSFIAERVLDLQEILIQVDAGKALIELSADLAMAVTSDEFTSGVESLTSVKPPLGGINSLFDQLKKLVAYAPEKEDLDCVSRELFLLLRVVHDDKTRALDINLTGKIRLLQWAYGRSYTVRGLGFDEAGSCASTRLGGRWLSMDTPSPTTTAAFKGETVVDLDFTGAPDIAELRALLTALGYLEAVESDEEPVLAPLLDPLKQFQETNGLEVTGLVDDPTLNRLHNLDSAKALLCRALPFGAKARPQPEPEAVKAKPAEARPAEARPAEPKPADAKPAEPKPADTQAPDAEAKPAETQPADADTKPSQGDGAEAQQGAESA